MSTSLEQLTYAAHAAAYAGAQFALIADVLTTQHQESLTMSQQLLDAVNGLKQAASDSIAADVALERDLSAALDRAKSAPPQVASDPDVAAAIDSLTSIQGTLRTRVAGVQAADAALGTNGTATGSTSASTDAAVATSTPVVQSAPSTGVAGVVGPADTGASSAGSSSAGAAVSGVVGETVVALGGAVDSGAAVHAAVSPADAIASIASAPAVATAAPPAASPSDLTAAALAAQG